jgi:alanine racemase
MKAAGINPGIVHAANSAAIIRYPDTHFDMVRLGLSLYGFHPCKDTRRLVRLHPAMTVKTRITEVKTVPMSEGVSYGMNYRSPGSVRICTLPVGYADGYRRGLSGRISVVLAGRRFPQVGNICMDQCMFEVDMRVKANAQRVDPRIGDEVTLVGAEGDAFVTIDEMADICGTIQHEIAIGFAQRMPRFWF